MHLPIHLVMPAHSFHDRYIVNITLPKPSEVCQTQTISGMGGDSTCGDSMVDSWMGECTIGYLVQVQLPHQESQRTPHRGSMSA